MKICVSIASYRDPDLINTVNSAYNNAVNKDDISFCIVSQAEEDEHPDLSHIPNVYYYKHHWSESKGVSWARNIAISKSRGDYILQIDSHSRFKEGWDEIIKKLYNDAKSYWGEKIVLTIFPDPFEVVDGEETYSDFSVQLKTWPIWEQDTNSFSLGQDWEEVEDQIHGDEIFYIAAGCVFASTKVYKTILPDPEIYFEDQMSLAIRAYSRGLRLINMPDSFVYSNYDREFNKRRLHWEDHEDWGNLDIVSEERLQRLYRGELGGFWGVESRSLYNQFIKVNGVEFEQDFEDFESEEQPEE